jgi:serpin B
MERRTFLTALLVSPALLAVLEACGSQSSTGNTSTGNTSTGNTSTGNTSGAGATAGVARSNKPRATTEHADDAQAGSVVDRFGIDMYKRLAAEAPAPTNLVFSPASIAIALSMTRAGANGTTATEMDTVLHVSDQAGLAHSMNALTSELATRSKSVPIPGAAASEVQLSIANSLWAQNDITFQGAFLDLLASEYGAELNLVDYTSNPDAARVLINAWVDDATKHRIPELLAKGVLTADSRLTLVNAIYMKAPWQSSFAKTHTAPGPFTTAAGTTVQASMMTQSAHFAYSKGNGWQSVELPYIGGDLRMVIVLPNAGTALDVAVAALTDTAATHQSVQVDLTLPKFDITTSVGLATVLSAMGMPTAFDKSTANFSGMTAEEKLFIGAVIHQANITVDEDGTEAAAATAVVMNTTSAVQPQTPVRFTVDRPFVFAIRDQATSAILFLGHIGDPTQTRS